MTGVFDVALREQTTVLEHDNGTCSQLPVRRWLNDQDDVDGLLIDRCSGPTLDVGCGPGRLTQALTRRGISATGIDTSTEAVRMTWERGGFALLRDVFEALPNEGRWNHVLLADGNLGIGGDPVALLCRVHALLRNGGSALIEVSAPGTGLRKGTARLGSGPWFPWAEADAASIEALGTGANLVTTWTTHRADRWFVELVSR